MNILTHKLADLDGRIGIEKVRRFGREKIAEIEEAEVIYWSGDEKKVPKENVVFVDICLKGIVPDSQKGVYVFDHHPHSAFPDETASSLIDKFLELSDEKNQELTRWAFRADFQSGGDPMNILNIVKEMNLSSNDEEVQKWLSATVDAYFKAGEIDFQKGIEFFKNSLQEFLSEDSPVKTILQRWLERAEKATEDKMNIVHRTAVNLAVFGSEKTQEWLSMALKAVEQGQKIFQEASKDFEEAEKILLGRRVVVIGTSVNPRFNRFCRSNIAKAKMPRPLDAREDPIVVQFQPPNRGFQVFTNKSGYRLSDVVGGLRAEILKVRKQRSPPDWRTLKTEGTLPGTEPLYYQQGDYEVIMWGSLTNPSVMPMDISIEAVRRIVVTAVDQQYFPTECRKSQDCLRYQCPLFPWQLWRCFQRRESLRA